MFGLFHIQYGVPAVVMVALSSLGFGLFCRRHENLAGVTLLHFTAGCVALPPTRLNSQGLPNGGQASYT